MDQETSLIASPSFVIGFGRRAMESSRKPHAALLPVLDRRMPLFKLTIMGNQQSRWKLEKMFGIRRYIRLGSSSQIEPLLGAEGGVETKYQLFTDDHNHKADIETIHKRNSVLERKVDDLTRKVNDLLSRNSKGMEFSATCLTSQIILSEPKDIICPMEMEYQEGSNSSDELAAGMIILIFLISFLIGMQIPTFT